MIYVWDVVDGTGTRLHRIQGQQQAAGGEGEGWNAVQAETMEADRRRHDEPAGDLACQPPDLV